MLEDIMIKDKLDNFFKQDVKIHVCGNGENRSGDIFNQPSIALINASAKDRTIYAESAKDQDSVISISFDKPIKGGDIEKSTTKVSRDLTELEVFNKHTTVEF